MSTTSHDVSSTAVNRERWWLAPLVAGSVALILRLAYMLTYRHSIAFDAPIMDEAVHDLWARGKLDLFYQGIPYFRAPLYPWFLELLYHLDRSYLWPRLVQAVLSATTVVLVADTGRRIAGLGAGLVGGLLLAFCWPAIYFSAELLIVTFFSLLAVIALWFFTRATQDDSLSSAVLGALCLGIASIARPTALMFLPVLVFLPLWIWPRLGLRRLGRRSLRLALSLLIVSLLPGLALTVRNVAVGHDLVFIASQGGVNFYIGNNPESDGRTAVVPGTRSTWLGGYQDTIARAEAAEGRPLKPSEVSRYYYREGLRFWQHHPGQALRLYLRKARLLLGAAERSNNKNLHFWRDRNPVLRLPIYVSWSMMLALGLVGIALLRRRMEAFAVLGFLALYALGLLLFFINERFRLPLTIALAVFAGIPVVQVAAAVRRKRFRAALFGLGAVLLLLIASNLDRIGFRGDRLDADAFSWYTVGNLQLRKHRYDDALESYRRSLDIAERFHLRHFEQVEPLLRRNLVKALMRSGRQEQVAQQVQTLRDLSPDDPQTKVILGQYYLWLHDYQKAVVEFRAVLQRFPDQLESLLGLGWCQLSNHGFMAAENTFRRARELSPGNAEAIAGTAIAELLGNRNQAKAKKLLLRAVKLDPTLPQAHQYLGEIYRTERDIPKMLYHLRECLRLDPHNARVRRFLVRTGAGLEHPEGERPPGP